MVMRSQLTLGARSARRDIHLWQQPAAAGGCWRRCAPPIRSAPLPQLTYQQLYCEGEAMAINAMGALLVCPVWYAGPPRQRSKSMRRAPFDEEL